ncbi:3',5'-cyclic AMP phosphodiesterase CpdA [Aminobacter niigataensis]|uniref:3',5'-cyclic AMP phosphodiesterase CpdA n=1 Tax=Aminobacter niigataensis TaxID=83265 RepID=A0ABR6L324_9HYPH|nr:metallophosphoesterase [Aminobacter niigataensis]MBB4650431.1 3',5'-cyclic AMP phosphodiesterase CpdA [Aminobacter niigataensis]
MKIAVIADPHFHDIDYRQGVGRGDQVAVRTLADTNASTRVFNESFHATKALLDDIVRRGISLVVVAGDLTDDGQQSTMVAATALLADYSRRFGLRFVATAGNHDLYAIHGRHQSKRFLNTDGSHTLVTSDPAMEQGDSVERIVSDEMYCGGYGAAIPAMGAYGFFRSEGDLHWECPFGTDDRLEARAFEIVSADGRTVRRMVDASFLVEPVEGLWLLCIDANVFEPKDGDLDSRLEKSYHDSTDAGWNSMPRNKGFVLDWMKDVAARANAAGKRLIAFSHYPIIDPLNGTSADEAKLLNDTSFLRRTPGAEVSRAAAATGIKVHFSGHLHINDTAVFRDGDDWLVNIAVPSMVGFPPAYKIVEMDGERLEVETVIIADVPGHDAAFPYYRIEAARERTSAAVTEAENHADFLSRHLAEMVRHRYLPKEWPRDLAALVPQLNLGDLDRLAGTTVPLTSGDAFTFLASAGEPDAPDWQGLPLFEMVVDWYRLRKGREVALDFIDPARIAAYRHLAGRFAAGAWPEGCLQDRLASFMQMMMDWLASAPSRDFSVDLATGEVTSKNHLGRTVLRQTGSA